MPKPCNLWTTENEHHWCQTTLHRQLASGLQIGTLPRQLTAQTFELDSWLGPRQDRPGLDVEPAGCQLPSFYAQFRTQPSYSRQLVPDRRSWTTLTPLLPRTPDCQTDWLNIPLPRTSFHSFLHLFLSSVMFSYTVGWTFAWFGLPIRFGCICH